MKKILVAGIALLIVFLADGSALAWHRHSHFDVGVFIRPPIILAPPSDDHLSWLLPPTLRLL